MNKVMFKSVEVVLQYVIMSFCFVQNDELDDADDGPVDDLLASQQQDVHNSLSVEGFGNMEAFSGDNLVAPPNKVCTVPHCNVIHRFSHCEILL
jgi:hypothetical protein